MLIGISGKIGSGKDTAKDIITAQLQKQNLTVEHRSFGARLKETVAIMTGTTYELQCTHEGKNTLDPTLQLTYGVIQQKVGEALRKGISSDIWVRLAFSKPLTADITIYSDLRYPEEYWEMEKRGAFLIRMEGDPTGTRKNSTRNLNHSSEIALDNFPFYETLHNNGTLEELRDEIVELLNNIMF